MTKLDIRPVKTDELHQAADLMNSTYSIKKTPEYFRWRYFMNKDDLIWGAFDDHLLVGMIGTNSTQVDDQKATMVTDMIVSEKHRNKGIFTQMINHVINSGDSEVFVSFTNKLGKLALENNLWKVLLKIDNLVLGEDTQPIKKGLKTDSSEKITYSHSDAWMKWRFDQNPIYKYFNLKKDRDIAITKIFQNPETGKKYGDIVFCEATTSFSPIIGQAVSELRSKQVCEITTWALPETHRYQECLELGFRAQSQERYMCILAKDSKSRLLNPHLWDIHQADSEIY